MKNVIFIVFILCWSGIKAQTINPSADIKRPSLAFHMSPDYHELWRTQFEITLPENRLGIQKPSSFLYLNTLNYLPGLFCKMEYKLETKSKLAPRFRLGSLNYTEWMEGKRELYSRYWK